MRRSGYVYATPHFSWLEVACHDGTQVPAVLVPNMTETCELAEAIRFDFGDALVVVSGYRTPAYNKKVGGAEHSMHLLARALDIRPVSPYGIERLHEVILAGLPRYTRLGGLGIYPLWVHIDTRPKPPTGHIARWEGAGVGSEPA